MAVYFVKTNLSEEGVQVLLSKKNKLCELPDDSPNIFKLRSNIDRYMKTPSATFCKGKHSVSKILCYAKFLAYYTLENKSRPVNISQKN